MRSSGFEQTDPSAPAPVYANPTMIASETRVSDSLAEVLQRNGYEIVIVSFFAAKVLRKPIIIIDGKGQIQYAFDDQGNFLEGLAAEGNNLKDIQNISILNNFIVLQHANNCHFKAIKRS